MNALFVLELFAAVVARGALADLDRPASKAEPVATEAEEQRRNPH